MFKSLQILQSTNQSAFEKLAVTDGGRKPYHLHQMFWGAFSFLLIAKAKGEPSPKHAKIGLHQIEFYLSPAFQEQIFSDLGIWRPEDQSQLIKLLLQYLNTSTIPPEIKDESPTIQCFFVLIVQLERIKSQKRRGFFLNLNTIQHIFQDISNRSFDPTTTIVKLLNESSGNLNGRNALKSLFYEFWLPVSKECKDLRFSPLHQTTPISPKSDFLLTQDDKKTPPKVELISSAAVPQTATEDVLSELNRLRNENDRLRKLNLEQTFCQLLGPLLHQPQIDSSTQDDTAPQRELKDSLYAELIYFLSQNHVELFGTPNEIIRINFPNELYLCKGKRVSRSRSNNYFRISKRGLKIHGHIVFPAEVVEHHNHQDLL